LQQQRTIRDFALVVAAVFVVLDELADALFKLSWQIVIFQRIRFFIE